MCLIVLMRSALASSSSLSLWERVGVRVRETLQRRVPLRLGEWHDCAKKPVIVPGNRSDMLAKAAGLTPDAFVPDMEDSVPVEEKTNARNLTASCIPQLAQGGVLVIPRVNSLDTGLLEDDLAAVVGPHIYGVSVGKIYTPQDVQTIADMLARLEQKAGVIGVQ